ncbi:flagellar assembly protein FlbE [uncultured Brevundimonas sp.]|uniref:flagellar assembly protein FlbE n=1 Tax=uncultured Brevundimonas sp. TaxID=213418 RepID=UPI0026167CE3|nr:flagellar assembly protein FlbE [uncultured Brevundimonas sp.]
MSANLTNARPFIFDTEFDAEGRVVERSQWQPPKRSYSPDEVEALIAQARLEGRQQALNEAESLRANALAVIAQSVADAAGRVDVAIEQHRQQSAELSLTCAQVLASSAMELYPRRPLESAIEQLAEEIDASPRLLVRAHGLDAEARQQIEQICQQSGFTGIVAFREEAIHDAAFVLEWTDGRAAFDPFEVETRLRQKIAAALSGDNPSPTISDGSAF